MPNTLTGPSRASKYPYRYQEDVKDRNAFRMRMKAELKAMAKESFLEEMEKLRLGNAITMGQSHGLESNSFDVSNSNNNPLSRFQHIVEELQHRQHGNTQKPKASTQLDWSSPLIRNQGHGFAMVDSSLPNFTMLTARTDPGANTGVASPQQPSKKKRTPNGLRPRAENNSHSAGQQMFVLSTAPIRSHEELVHEQIRSDSASLESSSLLEQANRYTELQSLFQPPAMANELLESSNLLNSAELERQLEEEEMQRQQQRSEQLHKVESNIAHHKSRLIKSRQEDRYYQSGLLAKSALVTKPTQPRSYQNHRGRRVVDGYDSTTSGYQHAATYSPSHFDERFSRSNSPLHHSQQPHSAPQQSHHHHHHHHPSHHHQQSEYPAYDPNHIASTTARPTTSQQGASPSHQALSLDRSNHSLLTTDSISVGSGGGGQGNGAVAPPSSTMHATAQATPMSPNDILKSYNLESSMMSVDDFRRKSDQLDADLKKVVRDAVHSEMLADGRAQHYTKRFMKKMIQDKESLLVDRIEQAVGQKIATLQKELQALKAKKLRRFKRKSKRNGSHAPLNSAGSAGGDNTEDDASFFSGYYDIDEDELPGWLKNSGEILHVLERTQMNTGDPSDPHHIDVRMLNAEINRSIEMTLRRILTGQSADGDYALNRLHAHDGTLTENSSLKGGMSSDKSDLKANLNGTGPTADAATAAPSTSKVHGRIETSKDISKSSDGYGDFDKAAPAVTVPVDLPTSIKAKKKSKAEKLLGISTDGPPPGSAGGTGAFSNSPIDPSNASARPGGSLFGQLGNLFSSKPGAGGAGISPSMSSSKPSMMMSMISSRESTNSNSNSMAYNPPPSSSRPGRGGAGGGGMMAPIIDEGDEESSQRSSQLKNRPGSKGNNDSLRRTSGKPGSSQSNAPGGSTKKKKGNSDESGGGNRSRSNSQASAHSKNDANPDLVAAAAEEDGDAAGGAGADAGVTPSIPMLNPAMAAELAREESRYRELMQNLLSLADVKVNIKKELKEWERQFALRTGREAGAEDKATINDRYIAYKLATTQVQEAKDHVRACEDKMKEIRERAVVGTEGSPGRLLQPPLQAE